MHASLVLFPFLLPFISAAPIPANQIDALLSSLSKHITKAIEVNIIPPSLLASKPTTVVKVVLNPKIVPNPKATRKPARRSPPSSEELGADLIALKAIGLAKDDSTTHPSNADQVPFFDASLLADSLSLEPLVDDQPRLTPRALPNPKTKSSLTRSPTFSLKIKVPITATPTVSVPVANPKAPKFSMVLDVKVVNPPTSHPGVPLTTTR